MTKIQLTASDKNIIDDFNKKFEAGLDAMERAKQLNIGDYLVLYLGSFGDKMELQKNSYGAPVKYLVVHSTKHGLPFVKKVNKKGEPIGQLFSCTGHLETDTYRHPSQRFNFELDPDYADSLLLQDGYDPAQLHKSKQDIFRAVTAHNKAHKIVTLKLSDVVAFFHTINVGDTLWSSPLSSFLVQDKQTVNRVEFNTKAKYKDRTNLKGPFVIILTVRDKRGNVKEITPDFFVRKALYTSRPRSYKELNI